MPQPLFVPPVYASVEAGKNAAAALLYDTAKGLEAVQLAPSNANHPADGILWETGGRTGGMPAADGGVPPFALPVYPAPVPPANAVPTALAVDAPRHEQAASVDSVTVNVNVSADGHAPLPPNYTDLSDLYKYMDIITMNAIPRMQPVVPPYYLEPLPPVVAPTLLPLESLGAAADRQQPASAARPLMVPPVWLPAVDAPQPVMTAPQQTGPLAAQCPEYAVPTVEVVLPDQPQDVSWGESCAALIASIAAEAYALSRVMTAEGEKIQKIVRLAESTESLIKANESIQRMLAEMNSLECTLVDKLEQTARLVEGGELIKPGVECLRSNMESALYAVDVSYADAPPAEGCAERAPESQEGYVRCRRSARHRG